eukprot:356972-Chlamydomonas_euryale.AAC.2
MGGAERMAREGVEPRLVGPSLCCPACAVSDLLYTYTHVHPTARPLPSTRVSKCPPPLTHVPRTAPSSPHTNASSTSPVPCARTNPHNARTTPCAASPAPRRRPRRGQHRDRGRAQLGAQGKNTESWAGERALEPYTLCRGRGIRAGLTWVFLQTTDMPRHVITPPMCTCPTASLSTSYLSDVMAAAT